MKYIALDFITVTPLGFNFQIKTIYCFHIWFFKLKISLSYLSESRFSKLKKRYISVEINLNAQPDDLRTHKM